MSQAVTERKIYNTDAVMSDAFNAYSDKKISQDANDVKMNKREIERFVVFSNGSEPTSSKLNRAYLDNIPSQDMVVRNKGFVNLKDRFAEFGLAVTKVSCYKDGIRFGIAKLAI